MNRHTRALQRFVYRNWRIVLILSLVMALMIAARVTYVSVTFFSQMHSKACIKQYPYTSQSLDCDEYQSSADNLKSLDRQLDAAIAQDIKDGKVKRASVWTRDLVTRQTASTDELDTYAPASLLKLPLMIAYFKAGELDHAILQTMLVFQRSAALNSGSQDFEPQTMLTPGASYSVEDLIEHMIIYSDNDAAAMLLNHLDPQIFDQTLIDLGIKIPSTNGEIDFVTAKTYANIFRMLYNANYLTRDDSEKALSLMTKTTFAGITEPLPKDVVVSHKFGEREVDNPDGSVQTRELHDCGIVYKKNADPYTICIMTEGTDWNDMLSVIHDLSLLAYETI